MRRAFEGFEIFPNLPDAYLTTFGAAKLQSSPSAYNVAVCNLSVW